MAAAPAPAAPIEQPQDPVEEPPESAPAPGEETPPDPAAGDPAPSDEEPVEGDKPADGEAPKPGEHKRQGGYQRQISRLERQNQQLLEALQRVGGGQAQPPKEKTPEEKTSEQFEQFVDRRIAQRDAEREGQAQLAAFGAKAAEVRAKHADFDEVVASVNIPMGSALGEVLLTSEHGPEIIYGLASNPAELARIRALPPLVAAREIGRLEAKASGANPQAKPNVAPRKPTAPAPISPVTARGPTNVKPADDMNYEEYKAWRKAQAPKR